MNSYLDDPSGNNKGEEKEDPFEDDVLLKERLEQNAKESRAKLDKVQSSQGGPKVAPHPLNSQLISQWSFPAKLPASN